MSREHLTYVWQSGAEPDVVVRVRAGIVQIDVEHAGVPGVVPVAPADRQT